LSRPLRLVALLPLVAGWKAGGSAALAAQAPSLSIQATAAPATVRVQSRRLLDDGKYVTLLRSGFPLRLHYRLELWRVRSIWFDQFVREASWEAVVRHDPLADDFVLLRTGGATSRFGSAEDLARALDIAYQVTLAPRGSGRFYFVCRLDVTTLNDSDLQELTGWLRGEVSPAVSGEGNVGDALVRGAQRALVRIAGLPKLTLEARSAEFRPGG
jgi:hypothetical protein